MLPDELSVAGYWVIRKRLVFRSSLPVRSIRFRDPGLLDREKEILRIRGIQTEFTADLDHVARVSGDLPVGKFHQSDPGHLRHFTIPATSRIFDQHECI